MGIIHIRLKKVVCLKKIKDGGLKMILINELII